MWDTWIVTYNVTYINLLEKRLMIIYFMFIGNYHV